MKAVLLELLCSTFLTFRVWPSNFCSDPMNACSAVWASLLSFTETIGV
jgi:hypothetical protein